jgi:hypothetical protein
VVTALSPLKLLRQLRLQEAGRLGECLNADSAGDRVEYDDRPLVKHESERFVGAPPLSDVPQLQATAWAGADI